MKIFELQAGQLGPQLDQQLQGVAQGVDQNNNQPELPAQAPAQPDLEQQQEEPPEKPAEPPKKVDPYLVAQVKSMPYVTNYEWGDDSKVAPYALLQLSVGDLEKARTLFRTKINMKTLSDQYGLYADPGMTFYQDAMNFVEKVLSLKKTMDNGNSQRPQVADQNSSDDDSSDE